MGAIKPLQQQMAHLTEEIACFRGRTVFSAHGKGQVADDAGLRIEADAEKQRARGVLACLAAAECQLYFCIIIYRFGMNLVLRR
ncbi:MAG: hypothetical protein E6K70_08580 [Planctomycetota bacterium]|nr:MAG: hypothetical protein E6K70_08580 [Planctomycetota bacterium]